MGWADLVGLLNNQLSPNILLGAHSNYRLKNGHVHLAPPARDLPMVSHVRAQITVQFSSWRVFFKKRKMVAHFSVEIVEEWEGHTCW